MPCWLNASSLMSNANSFGSVANLCSRESHSCSMIYRSPCRVLLRSRSASALGLCCMRGVSSSCPNYWRSRCTCIKNHMHASCMEAWNLRSACASLSGTGAISDHRQQHPKNPQHFYANSLELHCKPCTCRSQAACSKWQRLATIWRCCVRFIAKNGLTRILGRLTRRHNSRSVLNFA